MPSTFPRRPNPPLHSDPACIAFRSLSSFRYLGFVRRLGAGGAGELHSLGRPMNSEPQTSNLRRKELMHLTWSIIWRQVLVGIPLIFVLGWMVAWGYSFSVEFTHFEIRPRVLALFTWAVGYLITTIWVAARFQSKDKQAVPPGA